MKDKKQGAFNVGVDADVSGMVDFINNKEPILDFGEPLTTEAFEKVLAENIKHYPRWHYEWINDRLCIVLD